MKPGSASTKTDRYAEPPNHRVMTIVMITALRRDKHRAANGSSCVTTTISFATTKRSSVGRVILSVWYPSVQQERVAGQSPLVVRGSDSGVFGTHGLGEVGRSPTLFSHACWPDWPEEALIRQQGLTVRVLNHPVELPGRHLHTVDRCGQYQSSGSSRIKSHCRHHPIMSLLDR